MLEDEEIELKADLNEIGTNGYAKEDFFDDKGEYIGMLAVELVNNAEDEIGILATPIKTGNSTFKIYWYAAAYNLHYYVDVHRPTGLITFIYINRVRDEFALFVPPLFVWNDTLSIVRRQETSSQPAHARYKLHYGPGYIPMTLHAEFQLNYLYTLILNPAIIAMYTLFK